MRYFTLSTSSVMTQEFTPPWPSLVVAAATVEVVGALAAEQFVVAAPATQDVLALRPVETIVAGVAVHAVVALSSVDAVIALAAVDFVVSAAAEDDVAPTLAVDDVVVVGADEHVVAPRPVDDVRDDLVETVVRPAVRRRVGDAAGVPMLKAAVAVSRARLARAVVIRRFVMVFLLVRGG